MKWWDWMLWSQFFECWVLRQVFTLLFHFHQRLFGSSSLSVIRVLLSAYLRLLIFLPAFLILACASPSPAFLMMYSVYKLNNLGNNIRPWWTPFPIGNQSVVPCPHVTVAFWPANRFLRGQVRWFVIPIAWRISTACCDPHNQRLWHSQWSISRCCSGILVLFLWPNGCWQFDLWFLCFF